MNMNKTISYAQPASILETPEDLQWLSEVHCSIAKYYAVAFLYGNEDCPNKIDLFSRNHYLCRPTILVRIKNRLWMVVSGEIPKAIPDSEVPTFAVPQKGTEV